MINSWVNTGCNLTWKACQIIRKAEWTDASLVLPPLCTDMGLWKGETCCTRQPDFLWVLQDHCWCWADRLIFTSCSSRHPCPFCFSLPLLSILSLWTVSFSSQHSSPGLPCLHHHPVGNAGLNPASSTNQPSPARLRWLVLALLATLLGLPHCFWAGIWLIFLEKHGRPGNSFWQLVSCLWSVHLCHR